MRNEALHSAIRRGDLDALRALNLDGAALSEPGPHDWPPLVIAAHNGDTQAAVWLHGSLCCFRVKLCRKGESSALAPS